MATRPRTVEEMLVVIDAQTERLRRELKKSDKSVAVFQKTTDRRLKKVDRSFAALGAGISKRFAALGAAAGAGILAGVVNPIGRATEALAEFDLLSKRIRDSGFGSEFYQTLGLAAEEASIDQAKLNKSLTKFAVVLGEARTGRGEFVETLKESHPLLVQQVQDAANAEEAFRALSKAVRESQSADERALLTKAAFGTRMLEMVRVLDLGDEGFTRTAEKARELGLVIEDSLLVRAEALQNEYGVAAKVIDLQFKKAFVELAPAIVQAQRGLSDFLLTTVVPFTNAVKDAADWVDDLARRFPGLTAGLGMAGRLLIPGATPSSAARSAFGDQAGGPPPVGATARLDPGRVQTIEMAADATADVTRQVARLNKETERATEDMAQLGDVGESVAFSMSSAFDDFLATGALNFTSFVDSALKDLARLAARKAIIAGLDLAFGTTPITPRAEGGPVTAGRPFLVGERGPELFVPRSGGTILPNGAGMQTTVITPINIDARGADAAGLQQLAATLPAIIDRRIAEALRRQTTDKLLRPRAA